MRARRALRRIEAHGNSALHSEKTIPEDLRKFVTSAFDRADIAAEMIKRDDVALDLVERLRSGRNEDGAPLTFGDAALYAPHVVDALDAYIGHRGWSPDELPARRAPARPSVTVRIEEPRRKRR